MNQDDIHTHFIHDLPISLQNNAQLTHTIKKIRPHGHFEEWLSGLIQLKHQLSVQNLLPQIEYQLDQDLVSLGLNPSSQLENEHLFQASLKTALKRIAPWRKGPFQLFNLTLESEWRCYHKWQRIEKYAPSVKNQTILDIGSGNGYFGFRMMGAGASRVTGCDPSQLYWCQFQALKYFLPELPIFQIPLGVEPLLNLNLKPFDQVYSMGVLYHRKDPIEHLFLAKRLLKEGGYFILETLFVEGPEGHCLTPASTYAKMPNVWFIPSLLTIESWLKRVGFKEIRCVNTSVTQAYEQATTDWMKNESLNDFLDKYDTSKTQEGHPRPQRTIFIAQKN